MLYWTKYKIYDCYENDSLVIYNTRTSSGITIIGKIEYILESIQNGIWKKCSNKIEKILQEYEFLIDKNKYEAEHLLVKGFRDKVVFDNSFLSLTIVPTDKCNLNCIYCYQSNTFHNMKYTTANAIIKYISKNKKLKKLHISWFGGEPLCNKKMVFYIMEKINEVCKTNNIILISDMTTNGTLLDLDTFNKLYSLKVTNYQITLDGCEQTHNMQRPCKNGENSYKLIIENLKLIKENIHSKFYKIGIRTNFTDYVDENFSNLISELNKNFSNDKRFYFFFQWVKNWGGDKIVNLSSKLLNDDEAIEKYGKWMDVVSNTKVKTGDISLIKAGSGLCIGCRENNYLINTDGSICKCTTAIYDDEFINKGKIGYVNDDGNFIIDKWSEISWLSENSSIEKCFDCSVYPICLNMPCPYFRLKYKKDLCNNNDRYLKCIIKALSKQADFYKIYTEKL